MTLNIQTLYECTLNIIAPDEAERLESIALGKLREHTSRRVNDDWRKTRAWEKAALFSFLGITALLPKKLKDLLRKKFFARLQVRLYDYRNFDSSGSMRSRIEIGADCLRDSIDELSMTRISKPKETPPDDSPLVSVIVATHNRAGLLSRSVLSLLEGDYPNFEVIIVDDSSSDETPLIVKLLMELDSRITYIRNPCNTGSVRSRDIGLRASKGGFIAFHDDDDMAHENRLSAPLKFLMDNPFADACYCDFDIMRDGVRHPSRNKGPFTRERYLAGEIMIGVAIMLFRKGTLEKCPFLPEFEHATDFDWVFRALRQGIFIAHCPANVMDYYSDADAKRLSGNNPESRRQHKEIRERERLLDSLN